MAVVAIQTSKSTPAFDLDQFRRASLCSFAIQQQQSNGLTPPKDLFKSTLSKTKYQQILRRAFDLARDHCVANADQNWSGPEMLRQNNLILTQFYKPYDAAYWIDRCLPYLIRTGLLKQEYLLEVYRKRKSQELGENSDT